MSDGHSWLSSRSDPTPSTAFSSVDSGESLAHSCGRKISAFKPYNGSQEVRLSEKELSVYYANYSPYLYALKGLPWQLFGTLTFPEPIPPESARLGLFLKFLRAIALKEHAHFGKLAWCLRQERGGRFQREHLHFLMFGLPCSALGRCGIRRMHELWFKRVHGTAAIVPFDPTQDAVRYVLKLARDPLGKR